MKKTLTYLLICVLCASLLSACTPKPVSDGLSQSELWAALAHGEDEAWADDDMKYYVVLDYRDGRFEFNQYNAYGRIIRNTGTTREFKYAGDGTYTFVVDYPAQSGFQTLSKSVTVVYQPQAQYNVRIQMYDEYDSDAGILPVSIVKMLTEEDIIENLWAELSSYNSWSTFDSAAPNDVSYVRFLFDEGSRQVIYAGTFNEIWEKEMISNIFLLDDGSFDMQLETCAINIRKDADGCTITTPNELLVDGKYTADYKSFLPTDQLWELISGTWSGRSGNDNYTFTVENGIFNVTYTDAKGTPTKGTVTGSWVERYAYTLELSTGKIVTVNTVFSGEKLEKLNIDSPYGSGDYFNGKG